MRFKLTALGAGGGVTPDQIARRIAEYLRPTAAGRAEPSPPTAERPRDTPSRYYADRGAEPGRWLGLGAAEARLTGAVAMDDFARVLSGRDPATGARLITAQGSAGRRPTLAVGTATRWGPRGEPIYDPRDAAVALGLAPREGEVMFDEGSRVAMACFLAAVTGADPPAVPDGSYLVPLVARSGARFVSDHELSRCEEARAAGPDAAAVVAKGDPDELLRVGEAAVLAGVTPRYLRALCRRYEERREEIDALVAEGRSPKRAYVVGRRRRDGSWWVSRAELVSFLRRRRAPAVRVGYDLTLTTEKSLGVLALLGDDETGRAVLEAIEAGNDIGLAYLEQHAAWARASGQRVGTRGWTAASFRHLTSRALDPFPHHHNVIANTVLDEKGTRRALDARALYWHADEASALATAEMRHRLTDALGVRWRPARHGGWEIDGITDEVVHEFSQRRNDIEDAVAEMEGAIGRGTTLDELQAVVKETRPAKQDAEVAELRAGWWERARRHGLTPRRLARLVSPESARAVPLPEREWVFEQLAAPSGLCAGGSLFTRGQVLRALVDLPVSDGSGRTQPLLLPPPELEALADAFLSSPHVVELVPSAAKDAPVPAHLRHLGVFSTADMLRIQHEIIARYDEGRAGRHGVVDAESVSAGLGTDPDLTEEQRALVARFCASGYRLHCAIGRAGTGKTRTMRAAVAAWQAAGYEVKGTAVKGEAARILGAAAGIPSETLAWYLVQDDPERSPLGPSTILIVDEASTVPDRDLHQLIEIAVATGATLRLIGDPAQHGAVGAGGMFRVLCERHPEDTPELSVTHRVRHRGDAAAADALRAGRVEEALALLTAAGHLHLVDDEVELHLHLLRRWWEAHEAGTPHPMVDRRNQTRRQLNRLAHRLLQVAGEVSRRELKASADRAFSVGDRVIARRTNRDLHSRHDPKAYVRNGAAGTVRRIRRGRTKAGDRLAVAFDGIGVIDIPRSFFDEHEGPGGRLDVGLDHAYALTSYAVQGATFGASASRIDEHATRAETYVDISRGRDANNLYLTRALDPLDGERLPKAPPPPLEDSVVDRLESSGPERVAIEIDPLATPVSPEARPTLGELRAAREAADRAGRDVAALRRAEQVRVRELRRRAEEVVEPNVRARLSPRPEMPYLAECWHRALGAVAVYRERWRPGPGSGPWAWALGAPVDDPVAKAERFEVIETLTDLVTATTSEELRAHGWSELPPWARWHLGGLAAAGRCHPDPRTTADLYHRVQAYRIAAGVRDDEPPCKDDHVALGPVPSPAALAALHRGLAHELGRLAEATPAVELAPV